MIDAFVGQLQLQMFTSAKLKPVMVIIAVIAERVGEKIHILNLPPTALLGISLHQPAADTTAADAAIHSKQYQFAPEIPADPLQKLSYEASTAK